MAKQHRYTNYSTSSPAACRSADRLPLWMREIRDGFGALFAGPWGWLPVLSVVMAFGLMLVAGAFRASVSGVGDPNRLYWLGLLILVVPIATRLVSVSASRSERLALVVLLGMGLYMVKVMHSPLAFTYPDELVHVSNAEQALRTQQLFGENSVLPVTPNFPGLPAVTSAIAGLSGLSIFASGLLVIGAARLLITLALFLIYERLSGSARLGGLAAVIYMANANYLYWSAQFAYESLALPLAVFVVFALVLRQEPVSEQAARPAILVALLGIVAVTITHHLASFWLAALLLVTALFSTLRGHRAREATPGLWALALASLGLVLFWNLVMAPGTFDYLSPVIRRGAGALAGVITGQESGRAPFESSGSYQAPLWEQVIGFVSVLLVLAATPLGLWSFFRRAPKSALAWVLVLTALAYFPLQALRLTGPGWEIANRTSEYLYVGIGFVISLAFLNRWLRRGSLFVAAATGIFAGVLFLGGVISGWPPWLRMAQPYLVTAEGREGEPEIIEPQGVAAALWSSKYLGPGNRLAADNSSARLMQAYGGQYALAGEQFGIRDLFLNETIDKGELEIIRVTGVDYLVYASPYTRWEDMLGLYYDPAAGTPSGEAGAQDPRISGKFDEHPGIARLLDTGNVVIYEIGGLTDATTAP